VPPWRVAGQLSLSLLLWSFFVTPDPAMAVGANPCKKVDVTLPVPPQQDLPAPALQPPVVKAAAGAKRFSD
jgi:hypothetical protein